ncbi:MAG: dTMP kinase [Candidatus Dadabacteria bacterium]|nr:dTMP kinase [Candidatus Dadabacteria bacterium]
MFITFEGIEGSGKSTQAKLLAELLIKMGHKATLTREPGWGKLGELIRRAILDERDLDLDPFSELCLFCADRAQHVRDFIKPRLQEGEIVICDRYFDSTVVYQGYGRKLEKRLVNRIARASTLDLIPDVTFLLNLPVRAGLSRLQTRGEITKMDEEPLEFHEMIRQGYMLIAKREPGRIRKINADREILEIHEEIKNIVLESLSL